MVVAVVAAAAAITVSVMTFRFTLKQEHRKWLRETRFDVYCTLLAELTARDLEFEKDLGKTNVMPEALEGRLQGRELRDVVAQAQIIASGQVQLALGKYIDFWVVPHPTTKTAEDRQSARMDLAIEIRKELGAFK